MEKREFFKDKNVVITGAAGVLCSCFSREFAHQECNVALLGRTYSKVKALEEELTDKGYSAFAAECDVTDVESVKKAKKAVNEKFGKCDILINGAGGNHPKGNTTKDIFEKGDIEDPEVTSFFDLDPNNFDFVFKLNLTGTIIPTQIFIGDMLENPGANILNISSMSAYSPMTRVSAYSAAKAGISNITQWLGVHFAKEGIRVNALAPGFFLTEQNKNLMKNPDGSFTARAKKVIYKTPMERFGSPDELLGGMLWLCNSDEAKFVTGITVPIDGGFTAYSGV